MASFGLAENLTYDSQSLGNSTASLFSFLEGKHPFCKEFIKAKKPFVVLGESILKRSEYTILTKFYKARFRRLVWL